MTTLGDLVESIHTSLHSYSGLHEQSLWLTAPCDTDDLTLSVSGVEGAIRGVAEVGDELIYVHTCDGTSLTLAPFGRGYRGTTASAHTANTPVTFDPAFPRVEIRRAITQAIEALSSSLFAVHTEDFDAEAFRVGYQLPATAERVLRVEIKLAGDPTSDNWVDYSRWDFAPSSPLTTGKVVNFHEGLPFNSECRVTYAARFGAFAADTDELSSVGLDEAYADLILYAVTARMIRFLDPSRLQLGSVENASRAQVVQAGDAGRLANQLFAMYQARLQEERRRLLERHPAQSNFLPR